MTNPLLVPDQWGAIGVMVGMFVVLGVVVALEVCDASRRRSK